MPLPVPVPAEIAGTEQVAPDPDPPTAPDGARFGIDWDIGQVAPGGPAVSTVRILRLTGPAPDPPPPQPEAPLERTIGADVRAAVAGDPEGWIEVYVERFPEEIVEIPEPRSELFGQPVAALDLLEAQTLAAEERISSHEALYADLRAEVAEGGGRAWVGQALNFLHVEAPVAVVAGWIDDPTIEALWTPRRVEVPSPAQPPRPLRVEEAPPVEPPAESPGPPADGIDGARRRRQAEEEEAERGSVASRLAAVVVTEPEARAFHAANGEVFGGRPFEASRDHAERLLRVHRVRQELGLPDPDIGIAWPD